MSNRLRRLFLLAACVSAASARADGSAGALQAGSYSVDSVLELPHLEGQGAKKTATICVVEAGAYATRGLVVLSENNPLGKCPASNARQDGSTLTFDIKCDGLNAAMGKAKYDLAGDHFTATIDMKMGGKNMTMMEMQRGHRIGDCESAPQPRS